MMHHEPFSIKKRLASFRYAFNGIKDLLRNEHNARIHCVVAIFALLCCWWLRVSSFEWMLVILLIGVVLAAEAINSAIETLADRVSTDYHPLIKRAKDMAAGAVLLLAIVSVLIGAIIFLPKIIALL